MSRDGHFLALAGGVGGAKLANGLTQVLAADALTIVVNTGDDFEHLGLHVSPDIDSVTYALAGLNDPVRGWGLAGESWNAMRAVARLGGPDWFALGDHDLATHLLRSQRLRAGETLSQVTAAFARRLGIGHRIVPMSDDPVRSVVDTDEGPLPFQDYFVRRRCEPAFRGIGFDGIADARPAVGFLDALADPQLRAIVLCPSNPLLSLRPILSLPGVDERLRARRVPVVAVSPFVGGDAVKGPAAKILRELGVPVTPEGLLSFYDGLVDALVVDACDADWASCSRLSALATDTLMRDPGDQARLAREVLAFIDDLPGRSAGA
ncbi:2-phospho-L-lactate transferase [Luteimonas saliphila]|uniref:2-phospho-L-lactate transferase n=1 Tax=Luteimonas saliphila TaxID=2804919 RepID=UPI00192D3E18|nr:2-phospho-L-lactate transferase [Luteimonas saliphila]